MEKVKVYKIKEAVENYNQGKKTVVGGDDCEIAIIKVGDSALFIERDGCHYTKDMPETVKIGIAAKEEGKVALMPDSFIYPTAEWILESGVVETEEVELPKWISYYGIKSRVKENCRLLKETMFAYKLDVEKYFA